jgi:hypothetical protein
MNECGFFIGARYFPREAAMINDLDKTLGQLLRKTGLLDVAAVNK